MNNTKCNGVHTKLDELFACSDCEKYFALCSRCKAKPADAFHETLGDNGWEVSATGRCKECEDIIEHSDAIHFNSDLGI